MIFCLEHYKQVCNLRRVVAKQAILNLRITISFLAWLILLVVVCFSPAVFAQELPDPNGPIVSNKTAKSAKQASSAIANEAMIGGTNDRTRFVAHLSKEVRFRVFTLADPYRVIIDLPDVNFQLPAGHGKKGRGLIKAFRYGMFDARKSRIVIDVTRPVRVEQVFLIKKDKQKYARLVMDLVPTDRKEFLSIIETLRRKQFDKAKAVGTGAATKPALNQPLVSNVPERDRDAKAKQRPVIVIDPGHGGIDPGAISVAGTKEKRIVLGFAKILQKQINKIGRYRAILTRDRDVFIPLAKRVAIARHASASLFISIHADSLPKRFSKKVRGATIYTLSEKGSDAEANILATRENRSDILAGVDLPPENAEVTSILIELAQRETKNLSVAFASGLLEEMGVLTRLHVKNTRSANFRVLKAPDVPSVLIELGYLSNPEDEKLMKQIVWQKRVARAISKEVDQFLSHKVAHSPF